MQRARQCAPAAGDQFRVVGQQLEGREQCLARRVVAVRAVAAHDLQQSFQAAFGITGQDTAQGELITRGRIIHCGAFLQHRAVGRPHQFLQQARVCRQRASSLRVPLRLRQYGEQLERGRRVVVAHGQFGQVEQQARIVRIVTAGGFQSLARTRTVAAFEQRLRLGADCVGGAFDMAVEQLTQDGFRLRVRQATNQLQDTSTLPKLRQELARTLTVQRARELGIEAKK